MMMQLKKTQVWTSRLGRGLAAILTIKIFLIAGAIALEACQSHEEEFRELDNEKALASFEKVVRGTTPKIKELMEQYPGVVSNKDQVSSEKIEKLERETRNILMPMVNGTKELLRSYEVEEGYLETEFKDPNDPRIALVGLLLLASENRERQTVAHNFASAFGTLGYANSVSMAGSGKDWVDCMIVAVGIDAVVDFLKGNVTEAIAKKAIRKIASRALGIVGAAIAVFEFGSCMGWY